MADPALITAATAAIAAISPAAARRADACSSLKRDLDLRSDEIVLLAMNLEDEHAITIGDTELWRADTVEDLARLIEAKTKGNAA
jgi:acyl carrier protein